MSIVVPQLQYSSGGKSVAIAASRRTVKVIPEAGSSTYNPDNNNLIRIDLSPSLGFLDVHNSWLSFRVRTKAGTVDHTKECRMDKNSMSWVRRLTIHSSTGSVLEDCDHYNLCVNMLHCTTSGVQYSDSIGQMIDNTGDRACRNAAMANDKGAMFNSGFDASGILNGEGKYLPLAFLQGPMTISLTLADFKDCFVGTAAAGQDASYEVLNVEYHANVLSMSEEYNARFSEQLRSRGIDMSFDTFKTHVTTLTSADMDLPISQNSASVKASFHVLRSKDKYNSASYDSLSTYKSGNLEEVQFDLGGQLYPTQPLKLKDDGVTSMYTHNLQSYNMFRNHNLGSKVDDRNFWSTEASSVPRGNYSTDKSYKALPVRRVYGHWVANSNVAYRIRDVIGGATNDQIADFTAVDKDIDDLNAYVRTLTTYLKASRQTNNRISHREGTDDIEFSKTVPTLTFIPKNAKDIHLIEQGMRAKMGLATDVATEATAANATDADRNASGVYTTLGNPAKNSTLGLDRFFKANAGTTVTTAGSQYAALDNNYADNARNVMYAGAPSAMSWGGQNDDTTKDGLFLAGIGVPFVDGDNRPILSKAPAFHSEGWVDVIPSDEQFYIGNSFETFMAEHSLVSGADLTNATPLHLRLRYAKMNDTSDPEQFYESISNKDVLTSFIHVDAVLRVQPDGTLISSV